MRTIFCLLCAFLLVSTIASAEPPPSSVWTDGGKPLTRVERSEVEALLNAPPLLGPPAVTVDMSPCPAPNAFGSPSWAGWTVNALFALANNLTSVGDRNTDPEAFVTLGDTYRPEDVMVTSFNSWRGVADPPVPFAGELGNRLHFCLRITGDGTTQFTLEDLYFSINSSDEALVFTGSFKDFGYNGTTRYGVDWGPDRVEGTADDIVYVSGHGGTPVDALYYVGVGQAYWPGGPGHPLTGQEAIDDVVDYITTNGVVITASYLMDAPGGPYADEVILHLEGHIFSNGFESGSTSSWTRTCPPDPPFYCENP